MRVACLIPIVLLLYHACAHAQQPDVRPYESEEDLWEALRENEITFNEFLDLLEIHRIGADGVVLPQSDWEQLPGSDAGYLAAPDSAQSLTQPESVRDMRHGPVRWSLRTGYDADLIAPTGGDGYTIARLQYKQWQGIADWEQDGSDGEWRRRTLVRQADRWHLELGNLEPRWGRGLAVGRRSRFIGATSARQTDGSVIFPTRSRFNGLSFSYGQHGSLSGEILLSAIRSDVFSERVATVHLIASQGILHGGYVGLAGEISRRDTSGSFATSAHSLYLRVGNDDRVVLGEFVITDDDATAKAVEAIWPFARGRVRAQAWSYGTRFINPWGGGPAHSDREAVVLGSLNEIYSTRTTGERGFSLSTRVNVSPSTQARWEWMTHKEHPDAPAIHHWTARLRWKTDRLKLTPFARGKNIEGGDDTYALGSYATYGTSNRQVNARLEVGRHHVDADRFVRAGLGFRLALNDHVRLAPAVRWVDPNLDRPADGYWYFYLTERIIPGALGRIEAALVWQHFEDRTRDDRIELRVRTMARME